MRARLGQLALLSLSYAALGSPGSGQAMLIVDRSSEGSFLSSRGNTYSISGTDDNVNGTVFVTADTLLSPVSGVSGSIQLAVLTFEAVGPGKSSISIRNAMLLHSNFNTITDSVIGVVVSAQSGPVAAPELSADSPISTQTLLPAGLVVIPGGSPPKKV